MQVEGDRSVGADAGDGAVDHAEAADSQERAVGTSDAQVAVDQQRSVEPVLFGKTPV